MQSAMADTFAALADPNRLRMVELLRSGPCTVNEISDRLDLNQPQVSKHLRRLRAAGMVDVEPKAQQRHYELRPEPLLQMQRWLERYRRVWEVSFDQLDALVGELKGQEKERGAAHDRKRHK